MKQNRYIAAFKESYNSVGLTTALAASAAMLNPLPLLVGARSAEQMLDMLTSLPRELPLETKRQTVRKMAALAAYEGFLPRRTGEFVSRSESEITPLWVSRLPNWRPLPWHLTPKTHR